MNRYLFLLLCSVSVLAAQETCKVVSPTASFTIPHVKGSPTLSTDPRSAVWKKTASTLVVKDCTRTLEYPETKTEVRAFWTDTDLYFLFACPYQELNLWLPAQKRQAARQAVGPGRGRDVPGRRLDEHPALSRVRDCAHGGLDRPGDRSGQEALRPLLEIGLADDGPHR